MKLQPLLIAVALVTGAAFAQAPNGTAKAPADMPAASPATSADQGAGKVHHKKVAHKKHVSHHAKRHHEEHTASARRHHHEEHLASAKHHGHEHLAMAHHNTHAMGAGPSSPMTDLNAPARERRMDRAYDDWMARRR